MMSPGQKFLWMSLVLCVTPGCHPSQVMTWWQLWTLHYWHFVREILPPHDYPYYWVILDPESKEDKVKVTNLKNLSKYQFFQFWHKLYTRHTFWSCLIRCANMKWIRQVLLKLQWRHRFCPQTDEQTDRWTDDVKPAYPPFNFVGYNKLLNKQSCHYWFWDTMVLMWRHCNRSPHVPQFPH